MKRFNFWKENLVSQHYTLSEEELAVKYAEWLKTKELDWLAYYGHQRSALAFIGEKDGLNSVNEHSDTVEIIDELRPTFIEYTDKLFKEANI